MYDRDESVDFFSNHMNQLENLLVIIVVKSSYDATTHFETIVTCVLNSFRKNVDISSVLYMHE